MSDVTETDAGGSATGAAKKGNKKLLLIGGAAVGLLLAAGAGAFVLMGAGAATSEGETPAAVGAPTYIYDLPQITVNLANGSAATGQYLRATVSLELSDASMVDLVEPRMARVLDAFQVYLRELRRSDLEGSAGIYRLKEELQRRVNLAVYPASVENVLFKELLIQ